MSANYYNQISENLSANDYYDDDEQQEPSKLNSYLIPKKNKTSIYQPSSTQLSKHLKKFNDFNPDDNQSVAKTHDFLTALDNNKHPLLYSLYAKTKDEKDFTVFLNHMFNNFSLLNHDELTVIAKKLFNDNKLTFNMECFNELLLDDGLNFKTSKQTDFKTVFCQFFLTKFSLDNFNYLTNKQKHRLWNKIDLSYKSDNKYDFLKKSIQYKTAIEQTNFWDSFKKTFVDIVNDKNTHYLNSYLNFLVKEKQSKNIALFISMFKKITTTVFKNTPKEFSSEDKSFFEQHFIYSNPDKVQDCSLNQETIQSIFSSIHKNLPHQVLNNKLNSDFLDSLGLGLFNLLETIYVADPENVTDFIFNSTSDTVNLKRLEAIYINYEKNNPPIVNDNYKPFILKGNKNTFVLFQNLLTLPKTYQNNLYKNIIVDNFNLLKNKKEILNEIISVNNIELLNFCHPVLDILSEQQQNYSIFKIFKNNLDLKFNYQKEFVLKNIFEQLNSLSLNSLNNFEKKLEFSTLVLKDIYLNTDSSMGDTIDEMITVFNKIIFNKKMTETHDWEHKKTEKIRKI